MDTTGSILRTEREKQKRSLEDIAKKLKINIEYLKAIENDNYQSLPAEVFTKAYLRLYADSLGLENNYILSLFESQREASIVKKPTPSKNKTIFAQLEKIFPTRFTYRPIIIITIAALIILSLVIFTKYKEKKFVEKFVNKIKETEIVEGRIPEKMSLKIKAVELTWVSVSTDNGKPEEWLLRAGETVTATASKKFVVKIGNAGGTKLIFNNKDLGELGPPGKVVDIVLP